MLSQCCCAGGQLDALAPLAAGRDAHLSTSLWSGLPRTDTFDLELCYPFPECVARVPVSLWGSVGEAVFAESCVRNRSQPFATVRNRQPSATVGNRRQPSATVGNRLRECSPQWRVLLEGVSKVCPVDSCRGSYFVVCRGVSASVLRRRSSIGVCRGSLCVSDLCRRNSIGVCTGGVSARGLCRRSYILAFSEEVSA